MIRDVKRKNAKAEAIWKITYQEFWDIPYNYDPVERDPSRLDEILRSGEMRPLTLGKLDGRTALKLLPANDAWF